MPISNEEFNRGERVVEGERATSKKPKTTPTSQTFTKTVQHKGQIKSYGQWNARKFFVKFTEGPDDKAMFQEVHWSKFKSGDTIEFESKYNPETEWHGVQKRHYVGVVQKDELEGVDIEIEVEIGYVTKWKEDVDIGLVTCKTYLSDIYEGIKEIRFYKSTVFTDEDFEYAKLKVFGTKEGPVLHALTVEVSVKKYLYHTFEISLKDLTYNEGSISFIANEFEGSIEVPWSSSVLDGKKDTFLGSVYIRGNYRVHGRWLKNEMTDEWAEKMWYTLNTSSAEIEISEENIDYLNSKRGII